MFSAANMRCSLKAVSIIAGGTQLSMVGRDKASTSSRLKIGNQARHLIVTNSRFVAASTHNIMSDALVPRSSRLDLPPPEAPLSNAAICWSFCWYTRNQHAVKRLAFLIKHSSIWPLPGPPIGYFFVDIDWFFSDLSHSAFSTPELRHFSGSDTRRGA